MSFNSNSNNCQHPDGCMKPLFTYCPHCHLYLCIIHLNEHHDIVKSNINQTIHDAENQRVSLEQQISKIKQQKIDLNNLYECELKNLNDLHQFVTNICENNHLIISDHERYAKQLNLIKQEQENNSFIQSFILQIDQILQQKTHIDKSKDQMTNITNILSIADSETTTDICIESCTGREEEEEDRIIEATIDDHSDELSITVILDDHDQSESDTSTVQTKLTTNSIYSTCPLSQVNAFGFSIAHNIPGMPCNYLPNSNNFTYNRCCYHLATHHCLRKSAVRLIMATIISNRNKNIDPTTLDLFSRSRSTEILSQSTSIFVLQCPLIEKNIYGLQNQHNLILCTPRPPLRLYTHLCSFHRFKPIYARRLIIALIENKSPEEELFKPHEQILDNDNRSKH